MDLSCNSWCVFECVWAVGLKYTEGFTKLWPSVWTIVAMIISFQLLSTAMKTIPIGTAYAMWTGIGAIGVAIIGMILFDESREIARLLSIALIVAGVSGVKVIFSRNDIKKRRGKAPPWVRTNLLLLFLPPSCCQQQREQT